MIAIDLGSNSLRMISRDCHTGRFTAEYEKIVKTAEKIHSEGIISDAAMERILSGFEEAKGVFDFTKEPYVAVTTEAMRRASNATACLDTIYEKTGVRFSLIDPQKEASYTLLAVERRLETLGFRGSFALLDIGGGSTELIMKKGHLSESRSFPIGIVTMADKYPQRDELAENLGSEFADLKAYFDEYVSREGKPEYLVATAGTPTTIAAFRQGMDYTHYDAKRINGSTLNYFECMHALDKLLELNDQERAAYVGVGREALILSGVMIFAEFFNTLDYANAVIIDDGLREGLAISACEEKTQH